MALVGGLGLVHSQSAQASAERVREELELLRIEAMAERSGDGALRDVIRARRAADRIVDRYTRAAAEVGRKEAGRIVLDVDIPRLGETESSITFNETRREMLERAPSWVPLFRRWDAESDACRECRSVHGEVTGVREPFSLGEPGTVHPYCRCTFEILTESEARAA